MAKNALKNRTETQVIGSELIEDKGPVSSKITRAIESAPAVKGGILVTFRSRNGGGNKHEVLPATEMHSARSAILNFMRSGLVPV
jgi:hypothetical protein